MLLTAESAGYPHPCTRFAIQVFEHVAAMALNHSFDTAFRAITIRGGYACGEGLER